MNATLVKNNHVVGKDSNLFMDNNDFESQKLRCVLCQFKASAESRFDPDPDQGIYGLNKKLQSNFLCK